MLQIRPNQNDVYRFLPYQILSLTSAIRLRGVSYGESFFSHESPIYFEFQAAVFYLELIAELKSMDEVLPRPTPDAQKELLDRLRAGSSNSDETATEEFDV